MVTIKDMSKYFKPELHELVFGGIAHFEVRDSDQIISMEITPHIYQTLNKEDGVYSVPDCMYLKYLSADEIESFGFLPLLIAPFYVQNEENVKLFWFQKDKWIVSYNPDNHMLGWFVKTSDQYGIYFSGICKDVNRFWLLMTSITADDNIKELKNLLLTNTKSHGN